MERAITAGLKSFLSDISNNFDISESELFKRYLISESVSSNSGYMLFVKEMYKNFDLLNQSQQKLDFPEKSKIIGNKWKRLTNEQKLQYKEIARDGGKCIRTSHDIFPCGEKIFKDFYCKLHHDEYIKEKIEYSVEITEINDEVLYKDVFGTYYKKNENGFYAVIS